MEGVRVFHVDAFTTTAFGGNPAGVVPNAEGLNKKEMQLIAKELNLSETAFLTTSSSSQADYQIQFFTPTKEIDFCGHATVGAAWVLGTMYQLATKKDQVVFETNIGIVPVQFMVENDNLHSVLMTQVEPSVKTISTDLTELVRYVGIKESDIDSQYPVRLGYTGNWHLLIPVKSRNAVDEASPKLDLLKEHNERHHISTTHLFTFDCEEENCLVYTRDFAPAFGINEDPVTGSANGALSGYFILEGILDVSKDHHFQIAQGHSMGRPGFLQVIIKVGNDRPVIQVGGSAVITIAGNLLARR